MVGNLSPTQHANLDSCLMANSACESTVESSSLLAPFRTTSPVTQLERLLCPGYGSLTLLFCLATRRCMNLGPSFLEASTPSYRNISQT